MSPATPEWPVRPVLSAATRAVVQAARDRVNALCRDAGATLAELRAAYAALGTDERGELMLDGFRWRYYWHPDRVLARVEREDLARRRLMIASSHAISRQMGEWVGPTGTELQRRRYPPDGDVAAWIADGDTTPDWAAGFVPDRWSRPAGRRPPAAA